MRRYRSIITLLLLVTIPAAALASTLMTTSMTGEGHVGHSNMARTAVPIPLHHQNQDHEKPAPQSACAGHCTCASLCASGLIAIVFQPDTLEYAVTRHWINHGARQASLVKPRKPFRPPIVAIS